MTTIPNPPSLGDTFLNEVTGVTYEYDGEKWIVIKTPGSEEAEQISEDLTALTSRVADGETVQGQIQETISDALEVQERTVKKDESNTVTTAFRIRSDSKTFISTASGDLGLYNVADPTNPAHALNLGYADDRYLQSTDVDGSYLPLSGGDMTGDINMQNCRFDTFNAAGEQTMEIAPSGFIKSRDMLRVVRDDGGPALEARTSDSSDDITFKLDTSGNYMFTGTGDLRNDVRLRDQKSYIVRGSNNTNVGRFRALNDTQCMLSAEDGKKLFISNVAEPFLSTDAATKGYVDQVAAPFVTQNDIDGSIQDETVHLPLIGGNVSGRIDITMPDPGNASIRTIGSINVKADNQEIGGSNNFIAHKDYVRVYSTPSGPQDVVNKAYLEEQIASVETPDLASYAKKDYADDLTYRPARLRWLFEGINGGSSTPANQSFKFDGDFIRCSFNTFNGVDLGVGLVGDTGAISFTDGPVGIIWYKDANFKWKMKQQFRINAWRWNYNNHFELKRSSKHPSNDSSAFSVGATYYITVGGFF